MTNNKAIKYTLNGIVVWFFILNPVVWMGQTAFFSPAFLGWGFTIKGFFQFLIFPMYDDFLSQDVGQPNYFLATITIGVGILLLNLINQKRFRDR